MSSLFCSHCPPYWKLIHDHVYIILTLLYRFWDANSATIWIYLNSIHFPYIMLNVHVLSQKIQDVQWHCISSTNRPGLRTWMFLGPSFTWIHEWSNWSPERAIWFSRNPEGINKLGQFAKVAARKGGLEGRHTNHGGILWNIYSTPFYHSWFLSE